MISHAKEGGDKRNIVGGTDGARYGDKVAITIDWCRLASYAAALIPMRPLIAGESSRLLGKSRSYLLVTLLSISDGQSRRKDIESRKNGRN